MFLVFECTIKIDDIVWEYLPKGINCCHDYTCMCVLSFILTIAQNWVVSVIFEQ